MATAQELASELRARFSGCLSEPVEFRGEISLQLSDPQQIFDVCAFAREKLGFDLLVDITSIDHYGDDPRYTLVYHLYGIGHGRYLRLRTSVSEETAEVPTVTSVWKTADWHEREIYDMMGVRFRGHPDLRRILMWEGYPYHPLRKDFPLSGKPTDLPEIAFTETAPQAGGPFVTTPGRRDAASREPRVRSVETNAAGTLSPGQLSAEKQAADGSATGKGPTRHP